ncbi:MAG TPA: MarR family transcriptional regulator, partial [Trueperaceae bacterium]
MPHAPDMIPPGPKANVLAAIKERGRATVGELAAALGVTRACVHSHLTALKRAELVRKTGVVQVWRGRPEHTFELTEAGDRLFPKNY